MANRSQLLVLSSLLCATITVVGCTQCGIAESDARRIVLEELTKQRFDPELLSAPVRTPDSCSISFEYDGGGAKISYVIAHDPLHGLELHRWDHAGNELGP